jgi:hypothetical protein
LQFKTIEEANDMWRNTRFGWGLVSIVLHWLSALAIVGLLSIQGFGLILPGEVRIYRQITSDEPDVDVIGAIGMRNARLSAIQGLFQLAIIAAMVYLRWGGF